MMKPQAFVENIMLRGLVRELADALERELKYRYKHTDGKRARVMKHELELVEKARNRVNSEVV
jgi:hypothetical protein